MDEEYVEFTEHQGPLPDPQTLHQYNLVEPGLGATIIRMAEKEQAHRHKMEWRQLNGAVWSVWMGQIFAFLIGAGGIGGGIYLLATGKEIGGLTALVGALGALVGVYIYSKKHPPKLDEAETGPGN